MTTDYSRPLLLAALASGLEEGLEQLLRRRLVAVSIESDCPGAKLAGRIAISMLQRLPSRVVLETSDLGGTDVSMLEEMALEIAPEKPLMIAEAVNSDTDLKIHFGRTFRLGWLRSVPARYGAYVVRGSKKIDAAQFAYAIASATAAALGVAEIFKDLIEVLPSRRVDHDFLSFCPVTLSSDLTAASANGNRFLRNDLAIAGVGAVGSAVALILGAESFSGRVQLIDRERYSAENKATYALGTALDVERSTWKTAIAAAALSQAEVIRFDGSIEEYVGAIDVGAASWPRTVISALDSIDARHETQRLWPDNLIDAATGDTMLGLHHAVVGDACLQCFLPKRISQVSPLEELAERTGLSLSQVARGDDTLEKIHLIPLTSEQRTLLAPHVGKKICALANAIGLTTRQANGFQPSVPFVSMLAASLAVGRLIALNLGIPGLPNFVQFDSLIGPAHATVENRKPTHNCYCQERSETIDRLRERHERAAAARDT